MPRTKPRPYELKVAVPKAFRICALPPFSFDEAVALSQSIGSYAQPHWLMRFFKRPAGWHIPDLDQLPEERFTVSDRRYQWLVYEHEVIVYYARTGGIDRQYRAPRDRFERIVDEMDSIAGA
jgi:hypothetical protein